MKQILVVTALLIITSISSPASPAGWERVGVGRTGGNKGVWFVDADHGYVSGENGLLLSTTDGGGHWTALTVPTAAELWGVFASTTQNGDVIYVAGDDGTALKSTDGGLTWVNQNLHFNNGVVFGLYGYDAQTVCITGGEGDFGSTVGVIVVTHDGGNTWTKSTVPGTYSFDKSYFVTPDVGYAAGSVDAAFAQGVICKTTDGGTSWAITNTFGAAVNSMFWFDSLTGVAVGFNGLVVRTEDGGASWTAAQLPAQIASDPFTYVDFVDSANGYIADAAGRIVVTIDGGRTWQIDSSFTDDGAVLWGLGVGHGVRADRIVAVGDGGSIYTKEIVHLLPVARVDPSVVDFGLVYVAGVREAVLHVSAANTAGLIVKSIDMDSATSAGVFTAVLPPGSLPASLVPGDSMEIVVRFQPADTGNATASLRIGTNALPDSVILVQLKGAGAAHGASVPLDVDRGIARQMRVLPNPADIGATLHIHYAHPTRVRLVVCDLLGAVRMVLHDGPEDEGSRSYALPLDRLGPGVYLCTASCEEGASTCVVVVRR